MKGGGIVENILNAVANFGFPIAVTVYLLVRVESRLEQLTNSIYRLAETIASIK